MNRWGLMGTGLLLAALGTWLLWRDDAVAADAPAAPPPVAAATPAPVSGATPASGLRVGTSAAESARQALWAQRLARSQAALTTYRETTRYPHTSRPAAEQPDQMQPNRPIVQQQPLRLPGGGDGDGLVLRSAQQRVFVEGDEDVTFTLAVLGADGQPRPLAITQALAHVEPVAPGTPQVALAATADAAGHTQTLRLHPARQGFGGQEPMTIRVEVGLESGGQAGYTYFDIVYSPLAPATWAGPVRDRLVAGSLRFELPVQVSLPGRYVATGRVDDANGKPFALLSFNDTLPAGRQVIGLTLFGKLVRDTQPALPLRLRDVEAFLLHENRFPDRSLLPRLAGPVHVSGSYPLAAFSAAEWHSEERDRYLAELTRDVDEAQRQLGHPTDPAGR